MKIRYYKLRPIELIYILLIVVVVCSEFLSEKISGIFLYADDICVILTLLLALKKVVFKNHREKLFLKEKLMLILIFIIVIIGLIGNIVSYYQVSKFAILVDLLGWQKFFLMYVCMIICIKKDNCHKYLKIAISISKVILIIGCFLEIFNLLGLINLTEGYERFGFNTFSFGGHPSSASAILAVIISVLLYEKEQNGKWIILGCLLSIATFRFKAIAFVCLVVFCLIFMKKRLSILKVLLIGIMILFITWDQVEYYFSSSTASRAMALRASIEISEDFFPIGSGFATFGTNMSGKYYSKAYKIYGLSNRWGFTEKNYGYIGDGGVATIIGQFGMIGVLGFLVLMLLILGSIKKRWNKKKDIVPYISVLGYILISVTNEGGFNSSYAIIMAIALVIMVQASNLKENM